MTAVLPKGIFIVAAQRTPFGSMLGTLKGMTPTGNPLSSCNEAAAAPLELRLTPLSCSANGLAGTGPESAGRGLGCILLTPAAPAPTDLGVVATNAALEQAKLDPKLVDDIIFGVQPAL